MTEEEAKTKVCCGPPFVATAAIAMSSGGSIADERVFGKCIASACMAWREPRWETDDQGFPRRVPSGAGYCGLAGAPQ